MLLLDVGYSSVPKKTSRDSTPTSTTPFEKTKFHLTQQAQKKLGCKKNEEQEQNCINKMSQSSITAQQQQQQQVYHTGGGGGHIEPNKEPSELTQQKAKIAKSILQDKYMNQNLVRSLAQTRSER